MCKVPFGKGGEDSGRSPGGGTGVFFALEGGGGCNFEILGGGGGMEMPFRKAKFSPLLKAGKKSGPFPPIFLPKWLGKG